MPITPALNWLRQEGHKFKVSLSYIARPCPKKTKNKTTQELLGHVPVAQVYNLSYSAGRDQEDGGLKPAQADI
jgi:hypothetical protein